MQDEPPILVDWLPWNHTFGGNHNTGIALYNGGSFYIDDGKPGPAFIAETHPQPARNFSHGLLQCPQRLRRPAPSSARRTASSAKISSAICVCLFYAGAGLSQPVWDAYRSLALETCGERIIMVTGLGSTETAPMAIQTTWETDRAGVIGIPIPGVEAKLVPAWE